MNASVSQPVHTYIGGAHLFSATSVPTLGADALAAFNDHARDAATLARVLGIAPNLAPVVRARVVKKLKEQPIEDYRLDFEDGYGIRPDAEEDRDARSVAEELAVSIAAGTAPPFTGIRIKPMSPALRRRSLRTLELFVSTLARATRRKLPDTFVITLTKVMAPGHVAMAERACTGLERRHKLRKGTLKLEVMIETPQSVLAPDGHCAIPALLAAGRGRVRGALFGTYDYTTLCGISASWQHMRHSACDFAKEMMRVSLAQTGVWMSDGATNVMPVGPRDAVHRAWKTQFDDIQHSLVNGFYQGWDLHAAQLPIRFAAVYAFFLAARPAATARLRSFVERASQATLLGDVFDDAATGQALLNFFVRGLRAGALTLEEARETGLSAEDLQGRSFLEILESRRR